ncbi:hypothetical protein ACFL3H_10235, partial [Gemmatimonadota bacterium]
MLGVAVEPGVAPVVGGAGLASCRDIDGVVTACELSGSSRFKHPLHEIHNEVGKGRFEHSGEFYRWRFDLPSEPVTNVLDHSWFGP